MSQKKSSEDRLRERGDYATSPPIYLSIPKRTFHAKAIHFSGCAVVIIMLKLAFSIQSCVDIDILKTR